MSSPETGCTNPNDRAWSIGRAQLSAMDLAADADITSFRRKNPAAADPPRGPRYAQ
tara:strand:- start:255 stop:422 length:168 start_codon:yes stop_codon:yes gene_type:complete